MVLDNPRKSLQLRDVPRPKPGRGQLLVRVATCAVCRTDLHVIDGELPDPKLPLILGHEIVGLVQRSARKDSKFQAGDRVGIPWLGWTGGQCRFCRSGARIFARTRALPVTRSMAVTRSTPSRMRDIVSNCRRVTTTSRLHRCFARGLIGYRSYRKTGDARRLGIYGFGNAAHLIAQIAIYEGRELFAFTRPGDKATQQAAKELGAVWAGGSDETPAEKLRCGDYFCIRWSALRRRSDRDRQRWCCRVRRNSHERHSFISVRRFMGGTCDYLGGKPDPTRWRGVFRNRAARSGSNPDGELPTGDRPTLRWTYSVPANSARPLC